MILIMESLYTGLSSALQHIGNSSYGLFALTLTAPGPTLVVRIGRLHTSDSDD